jgi:uncharacterized protein DUF3307
MNALSPSVLSALSVVGAVFTALYAAHMVGDHWVQTGRQACAKGAPTWAGRAADTAHVLTLTLTKLAALAALALVTGWRPSTWHLVAALAVDAVSHWWADRRSTLAALAERVGKGDFYDLGAPRPLCDDNPSLGTGAYALDQSWHIGWLFIAALITAA